VITLKTLKWGNAFSYGPNNEIDFSDSALVQLLGKNGHGKSSIALILEECLYNKNSKGIKKSDIINRYVKDKSYWIELDFERNGIVYKIKTTRGSTQTVKLYEEGTDISSHTSTTTYKQIEELMGMDHKTFSQIVYQSSVSSLEFLTATDTARKKFLIDLLNQGVYTEACDVFKEVASGVSKEVDKLSAKKETICDWLEKFSSTEMIELELEEPLPPPDSIKARVLELETELTNLLVINKKRTNNNVYKQQLDSVVLDSTDYSAYTQEDLTALEIQYAEASKIVKEGATFQSKLKSLKPTCPTCNQAVDNSDTIDMCNAQALKSADASKVMVSVAVQVADLKAKLTAKKAAEAAAIQWEKYHTLYDPKLPTELLVEADIRSDTKSLKDSIANIEKSIADTIKKNNAAAAHNAKIKVLREQEATMRSDLDVINAELVEKVDRLTTLQVLVKTFSTTGLVAYKIECLVKDLEVVTNEYLADLYAGRFSLSFQISSSDKLNVVINDNGRNVDILALSSGERARVNVATLLGIRKLMQSLSNSRINLLILDETVETLDAEGKEKLVEILLAEENLNTVLVSHGFSHPLIEKISVIKENNISRIE
jgi:DNA repair exonuclease SbcCD ATPase subunit